MRLSSTGLLALFASALSLSGAGRLVAEEWPQFRGPNCSGVSSSKKSLPLHFSRTKNVRWSKELGDGIGSPVIAAGRVFCTAMAGKKAGEQRLVVFCFDAESGKKLWQRDLSAGPKALTPINETNSYASSTPAADSERVYVYFVRTGLVALDAKSGEKV